MRASSNASSSNIETLYSLCNGRVEGLGFRIKGKSKVTNVPLKDLSLKPNVIIAGIYRNGSVIRPNGNDMLLDGDSVVVITKDNKLNSLVDILERF